MHNEKLIRTALKYEVYNNIDESLEIVGQFLYDEGLSDTADIFGSTAMCFSDDDHDLPLVIKLLNKLGYEIKE